VAAARLPSSRVAKAFRHKNRDDLAIRTTLLLWNRLGEQSHDARRLDWTNEHQPNELKSVNIRVVGIIRRAANRAEPGLAPALGFRAINSFKREFDKKRQGRQRADGYERNRGRLPGGLLNLFRQQHSDPQTNRRACESEQIVERILFGGFWNG